MNFHEQPLDCQIQFLDCLGYYDLAEQLLMILGVSFVMFKSVKNYIQLNQERGEDDQSQYQKSIRRKLIINKLTMAFLTTLALSIILSVILFSLFAGGNDSKQSIKQSKANVWYKFSEILFINILNSLNLTVGFLYWKACRAYYKMSQMEIPCILSSKIKGIFVTVYGLNLLTVLAFFTYILIYSPQNYEYPEDEVMMINIANLTGVISSTLICFLARILYDIKILQVVHLSSSALRRERVYTVLILISSLLRIAQAVAYSTIDVKDNMLRYFDQNCLDMYPLHAIYLFMVTVFISLMPTYIFCCSFSILKEKSYNYKQVEQPLDKKISSNNDGSFYYM